MIAEVHRYCRLYTMLEGSPGPRPSLVPTSRFCCHFILMQNACTRRHGSYTKSRDSQSQMKLSNVGSSTRLVRRRSKDC